MRVTRYRFWHRTLRQLCPVHQLHWDTRATAPSYRLTVALTVPPPNGCRSIECSAPADGILMAETSVEDRFGTLIFEDDILNVRGRGEWGEPALVRRDRQHHCFVYAFPGSGEEPVELRPGDDIEVVGNIHEHPGLLGSG